MTPFQHGLYLLLRGHLSSVLFAWKPYGFPESTYVLHSHKPYGFGKSAYALDVFWSKCACTFWYFNELDKPIGLEFVVHLSLRVHIFTFWVFTGYHLTRLQHAAGRQAISQPPPGPRYSSPTKRLYSASASLYFWEPPLDTPQISRMIFALP